MTKIAEALKLNNDFQPFIRANEHLLESIKGRS